MAANTNTTDPGDVGYVDELRPRITVTRTGDTWAACCADPTSGARYTVAGSRSAVGAVLGAASKLTTGLVHATDKGRRSRDDRTAVQYPAHVDISSATSESDQRLLARFVKWNVDLVAVADDTSFDPAVLDQRDVNLWGREILYREERQAAKERFHRARAESHGLVAYWSDGSSYDQGPGNAGFGGWAWVCEDGRSASGEVFGDANVAESAAIDAAIADATERGVTALVFTDSSVNAGLSGDLIARDGHKITKTQRNATPPMVEADGLARTAAYAHARRARATT